MAREALPSRRTSLTHARRAAGMALNAVLVARREGELEVTEIWGRSYLEHLRRLRPSTDPAEAAPLLGLPETVRAAAETLVRTPIMPPQGLVRLSREADPELAAAIEAAEGVSASCRLCVESA